MTFGSHRFGDISRLFEELSISTKPDGNSHRFNDDSIISSHETTTIEENSGFFYGSLLPSIGFMSYSWSKLEDYVSVGRYSSIAGGVKFGGYRHPIEWVTTSPLTYDRNLGMNVEFQKKTGAAAMSFGRPPQPNRKILIGNDVWIGTDVWINRGVTIADGCVVAAKSVVTKNFPPYSIIGGNPAKLIRPRFNPQMIESLLGISWWKYSPSLLVKFDMKNPVNFVRDFIGRADELFFPRTIIVSENGNLVVKKNN